MGLNLDKRLGVVLLSVWLVLYGLNMFFSLGFSHMREVMGGLALGAGVLLFINR